MRNRHKRSCWPRSWCGPPLLPLYPGNVRHRWRPAACTRWSYPLFPFKNLYPVVFVLNQSAEHWDTARYSWSMSPVVPCCFRENLTVRISPTLIYSLLSNPSDSLRMRYKYPVPPEVVGQSQGRADGWSCWGAWGPRRRHTGRRHCLSASPSRASDGCGVRGQHTARRGPQMQMVAGKSTRTAQA